jgi:uncharacterized protein (UPF0216 family)
MIISEMQEKGGGTRKRDGLTLYFNSDEIKEMKELFTEETFKKYQKKD